MTQKNKNAEIDEKIKKRQFAEVASLLDAELTKKPVNPEHLYNFALCMVRLENYKKAIEILKNLLNEFPRFIERDNVFRIVILSLINLSRFADASRLCEERLQVNTGDIRLMSLLAYCLEKQGKIKLSIEVHKRILTIKPDYKNSLNSTAYLSAEAGIGKLEDSLPVIQKALDQEPDNPAYLDTYGRILHKIGNIPEARIAFTQALTLSQNHPEIWKHIQELPKERKKK